MYDILTKKVLFSISIVLCLFSVHFHISLNHVVRV